MNVMNAIQCNCQTAYAVMCDMGALMIEKRVNVTIRQEPYVAVDGCVKGLPSGMDVYVSDTGQKKAAIVVNDVRMESLCVDELTHEHGVCV